MSAIVQSADRSDVNDGSYTSAVITVGTTAVELFTGGSRNAGRQAVTIYNDSNSTIYLGPSSVTVSGSTKGIPLVKAQFATFELGDVALYAIAGSAGNSVIVQELA